MALDAANFISELSITDPPGSDPLSQGDDQIRTIKRATFQSFPNIDKAVTQTADQMNLMAVLNENNVWTAPDNQYQDVGFRLNALTDVAVQIKWESAGLSHWQMRMQNAAGGTDIELNRFDALGAFVEAVYRVNFTTGVLDFTRVPTVLGAPLWIAGEIRQFVIGVTIGANWFLANGTNGTFDLANRWLVASGATAAGNTLAANLDAATNDTPATGSTAISSAQMPSHRHRIRSGGASGITDVALGNVSTQTVVGANRGNTASQFFDVNSGAQQFIENTGGGSGHTHTVPVVGVDAAVATRDAVRPQSFVVATYQYVP